MLNKEMLMNKGKDGWNIPVTLKAPTSEYCYLTDNDTYTIYVSSTTTWETFIKKMGIYCPGIISSSYSYYFDDATDNTVTTPTYILDLSPFIQDASTRQTWFILIYTPELSHRGFGRAATSTLHSMPIIYPPYYSETISLYSVDPVSKYLHLDNYPWQIFYLVDDDTGRWNLNQINDTDLIINYDSYYLFVCCFLNHTPITLANGTTKPVQDITYEDKLLVWDFDKGTYAEAYPLWVSKEMHSDYYYKLTFSNGTVLKVTGSGGKAHRVFNQENGEFTHGSSFQEGQHTFTDKGDKPYLISCERVEEPCTYYNIITDYHMNLFADSILTSCGYNNMYPIKDMKFVKDDREIIPQEKYEIIEDKFYNGLRLGEQDLSKRDVLKAQKYVARLRLNDSREDA